MLTALLVVLLAVIAILAIPVGLTFSLGWPEGSANEAHLQWAFGLVRVRIPTGRSEDSDEDETAASRRKRKSAKNKSNVVAAIRHKEFRRRMLRFVAQLWRAVRKRNLRLHMRVGLGDPADTGQLWSVLGPVSGVLANVRDASISLEPDFVDATAEIAGSGAIRVIPLQLLYLTAALLLSPSVWQGLQLMRTAA